MTDPGPLIGKGRMADVYDAGPRRVLRRYRGGMDCVPEADVMRTVRALGYPVPEVLDADGPDMVMERLDGHTMLAELGSRPWRVDRLARQLAQLVNQLGDLPIDGVRLRRASRANEGPEEVIAHCDLHPDNVMLTPDGPVVFDWAAGGLAPRGTDPAMSWVILAFSEADVSAWLKPFAGAVRRRLISRFLADAGPLETQFVRATVERRLTDPNLRPSEAAALHRYLDE